MHRIFTSNANFAQNLAQITDPKETHHLYHVLRIRRGQDVCLFNGQGWEAVGTIDSCDARQVVVILQEIRKISLMQPQLILACALPKKSKFETIIEKCTEMGVDQIVPLTTARTEVRPTSEKEDKMSARYLTVAINAAKQCARATIPTIHPIQNFAKYLAEIKKVADPKRFMFIPCLTGKRKGLANQLQSLNSPGSLVFFIGPEGDFTKEEVLQAQEIGCIPISLGPTTLKVDTAALAVIAFSNLLFRTAEIPHGQKAF